MRPEPFSFSIAVHGIPAEGRHFHLEADADARRRLAHALDLPDVLELTADVDVTPLPDGAVSVRGQLGAAIIQTDVVTLEPIPRSVSEDIDVTLRPADRPSSKKPDPPEAEPALEEADLFFHDRIDLGALAGEHLALGLDPYPRAAGVEFEPHVEDNPSGDQSPFAVLKSLKGGD
jgi:hypothetical protein